MWREIKRGSVKEIFNTHLRSLSLTGSFRFPSLITYLFLYQNVEEFLHLGLNIRDENKKRQYVVLWTDIVRNEPDEGGIFDFATSFMPVAYNVLNDVPPPCFLPKAQECLQLRNNCNLGIGLYMKIIQKLYYMELK